MRESQCLEDFLRCSSLYLNELRILLLHMESSDDLTNFLLLLLDFLHCILKISIEFCENLVDFEDAHREFFVDFGVGISPSLFFEEFEIDLLEVFLNLLAALLLSVLSLFSFH